MGKGKRKVRTSRLGRLTMLAGMAARLGGDAAVAAGRLATTASSTKAATRLHERAARTLLDALGEMKGLPMKLGQMLSYVDDQIPEEYRHIYREVLRELQVKSKPLPWEAMAAVIEEDLGERAAALLDAIEREPIAAASIGQVYRAVVDGRAVAVKVQYPGIGDAVGSDLKSVASLIGAMSLVLPSMDVEQTLSDVTSRLGEECDYLHEAASQCAFRERWAGDAEAYIPEVVDALSSKRVLVSELVEGASFQTVLDTASAAEKSRVGRVIARFVFRSLYVHGVFNADPHPGNYIFMRDGRVAFIDYGCVQRFSRDTLAEVVRVRHMLVSGERGEKLRELLRDGYGMPELEPELWAFVETYLVASFEPLLAPQPFRYTRAYTDALTKLTVRGKLMAMRQVFKHGLQEAKQPGLVFLNRINFGLASLLALLEAEGDWRGMLDVIDEEGSWQM